MGPRRQHSPHHRRANDPDATLLEAFADATENMWRKIQLFALGLAHLLFSSDSQWLKQLPPPVPVNATTSAPIAPTASNVTPYTSVLPPTTNNAKRIIFVRHAESEWNVVFNRSRDWRLLVRFVRACFREWFLLPTRDSIFIDSPLSIDGMTQARALFTDAAGARANVDDVALDLMTETACSDAERAAVLQYISSPMPHSIVVTSNLRRAIATAQIASATRLHSSNNATTNEQLHVLSSLQEIGRNIDTLALEDAPPLPSSSPQAQALSLNVAASYGNKQVRGSSRQRLDAFAQWVVELPSDTRIVVVYGHSLWFRAFCRTFMGGGSSSNSVQDAATRRKLANCGVASFVIEATAPSSKNNVNGNMRIVSESFRFIR